mmetsp:Transcript_44747/g.95349  ORF Transcript_44747/g.95349 Transcript_44747/m.95349 type:complete len:215 (+) Transcript_44747:24-668(+)
MDSPLPSLVPTARARPRIFRSDCSLADRPLLLIPRHATVHRAVESIVAERPIGHAAAVPHLVALLEKLEVEDILDVGVDGVDLLSLLGELVHHAHKHEDLVALTTSVEEALTATEPKGHMLTVPSAATATHHALGVDGRHQHRILDGAEGANEGGGLEVLIKLDDAQDVLCRLVHNREAHIAAKLMVRLLRKVLWVHNGALCTDAPVPIGIDEA